MNYSNEEVDAAYHVLNDWNTRLNKWEYSKQKKLTSKSKVKSFKPHYLSCKIIDFQKKLLKGKISPPEAIAILHTKDGFTQRKLCIAAGF